MRRETQPRIAPAWCAARCCDGFPLRPFETPTRPPFLTEGALWRKLDHDAEAAARHLRQMSDSARHVAGLLIRASAMQRTPLIARRIGQPYSKNAGRWREAKWDTQPYDH